MAVFLYSEDKKSSKINHYKPIGLTFTSDEVSQVDIISFVPLKDKVISIFNGDAQFSSDDSDVDYDEQETEVYGGNEDDLEISPVDEYSDKIDVLEANKEIQNRLNEYKSKVSSSKVEELKDNSTVPNNGTVEVKEKAE